MNPKVLVRIYDTSNRHLEDFKLPKNEAIYLEPGGYLGDYPWSKALTISGKNARKIQSVGSDMKIDDRGTIASDSLPWISIWVD